MLNPTLSAIRNAGFSLIEMLVAVTLMLLMVGAGTAAFINFNDRQILQGAAKDVQAYFRTAQSRARAGDRPDGCDKLVSYGVVMNEGSNQVNIIARCEGALTEVARSTYSLPLSVSAVDAVSMDFLVLHGGVTNPGSVTLTHNQKTFTFTVTAGGEITGGEFAE